MRLLVLSIVMATTALFNAPADAREKPYTYINWGCDRQVTWKTNAKPKFVSYWMSKIDSQITADFIRKKKGKADLVIKFMPSKKIERIVGIDSLAGYTSYKFVYDPVRLTKTRVWADNSSGDLYAKKVFLHEIWHAIGVKGHVNHRYSILNTPVTAHWLSLDLPNQADWNLLKKVDRYC